VSLFTFRLMASGSRIAQVDQPTTIRDAPFSKVAIDKSVDRQVRTTPAIPAYEDGYKDWLEHCGDVYTATVAEVVVDTTFNAGLGCQKQAAPDNGALSGRKSEIQSDDCVYSCWSPPGSGRSWNPEAL
jgi:hypothetical protein